MQCYNCEKYGHYASKCRNAAVKEEKALCAKNGDNEEPTLLMICDGGEDQEAWFLDTGASNHMTGKNNLFISLDESFKGDISFGDARKVDVQGRGDILIQAKNGIHQFITQVYYVPALKSNILSLGQLLEKEYEIVLKNGALMMRDNKGHLIVKVQMSKNILFSLKIQTNCTKCLKDYSSDSSWLWHQRMGHLNFKSLKQLTEENMVHGLTFIDHPHQFCEGCIYGKQFRTSFLKESFSRATEPLELVYADICGPINPPSFGKKKYFLLFIDDYSRKTWVYFLKEK